jgi:hypothetical protein
MTRCARSGHDHWIGASLRWPMIRRLFWRATVDEDGHYCFAVAL